MKTYSQKTSQVTREWHLEDAQDQVLGRFASRVAQQLIGKHKATYTPHIDGGDFVVVINAKQVALTRGKEKRKLYYRHSGYPGNLKTIPFADMIKKHPQEVIRLAVKNMLPKNKLRADRMARLKIYADDQHKHQSQLKPSTN